jgi:hypothetical protein
MPLIPFGKNIVLGLLGGGVSDTTGPACAITSTSSGAVAGAFSVTITFTDPATGLPEAVIGFALGDITCSANAGAGTLANPSTGVYTATITPTSTGAVTVQVEANKVTDAALNNNTASNTFSILYIAAVAWFDFSVATYAYQDSTGTTPVTADGQVIGRAVDRSPNNNHALQAGADTVKPTWKTNIQNGLGASLGDGADWLATSAFTEIAQPNTIFCVVRNPVIGSTEVFFDGIANTKRSQVYYDSGAISWYAGTIRNTGDAQAVTTTLYTVVFNGASSMLRTNGVQTDAADIGANPLTGVTLYTDFAHTAAFFSGYIMEYILINASLGGAALAAIESYINTKWAVF